MNKGGVTAWRRNQKGFTLIELMAVLAILAIIIAIAVPSVGSILAKSETSANNSSIELIERAGGLAHLSGLGFDESGVPAESYSIPSLAEQGYLKLEASSPFYADSHYVQKQPNGTFLYNGAGSTQPTVPPVVAEPEPTPNAASDFTYTTSGGKVMITDYVGTSKDVVIPRMIAGNPVTTIGSQAFATNQLTSVVIPDSVTLIGTLAFYNNQLTSVTIPDSVTAVGNQAFYTNKLTALKIGDSVKAIGSHAFSTNQLVSVTIPDSVTLIDGYAFNNNKLTEVTIPKSVTTLIGNAFSYNNLSSVTFLNPDLVILSSVFDTDKSLTVRGYNPSTAKTFAGTNANYNSVDISK